MYPLTIGLAIENRELWDQAQATLAELPFRIIVEHQDVGDVSNFMDRLERMRPDVVLVDISGWKEPLEGLVASIKGAAGDPMIIALNTTADADSILSSLRAGINEYLYPPLQDSLKKSLERRSLGRSLTRMGMAALEEIDEACLVTTLEVPALHQSKQIIQTLIDSDYGKNRIKLILNRAPKRLDITPGELEKMLGTPIFATIPNDY